MIMLVCVMLFCVIGLPFIGHLLKIRGYNPPSWKYLKPFSLTWWVGAIPAVIGSVIASDPLHGFYEWTATFEAMTGSVEPAYLIGSGLAAIGLRGKDE